MATRGMNPSAPRESAGEEQPEAFHLKLHTDGPRLTVRVSGPLDVEHTATLLAQVRPRFHRECRVTVDLSGVPYLDSTGVRGLLALKRALEERHGELCLVVPPGSRVEWILRLLQMEQQLGLRSTPDEPADEPNLMRAR